ncbi:MAG: hypothetical protein HON90_04345, partial [Halobacteriovoraceae bacterium]|nr:hypothetical protein [Halobacteriovoraceae bacterium]
AVREAAQNHANALKNDAADIGYKGTRTTLQASILGTSSLCTSVSAVVNDHIAAIEANRNVPIPCCGVLTEKGATLDSVSFGKIPNQDQVADASAANSIVDINKNHKYYVKVIIENVLRKIAMQKINKMQISTPVEKIRKIASIDSYINYIVENQSALFEKENIQKEIKKLHDRNDIKDKNIENYFLSTISKLKKEMLVDSANAGDDFKELLKLGVKLLLLYYTMGSWLKENALPKPSTRAWTWGIMSVVNAAIIKFDTDSKKEAESRVATVQAEREAFVKSHANNSVYGNKNAKDKGEYELGQVEMGQQKRGKNGLIGCAVPKGNGFAPTECPSVIPRQRFNFPQAKRTNVSGSLTGQALGMIGNMSHAAASNGMIDSDDSFSAGKIDKLSAVTSALRKRNDKLIKKYDDLTNKRDKSLKKKSLPLSKSMAKFKTLFTGNPKKTGVSKAQMAAGSNLVLPKLEKLKKKQAKLAKIKPINIPKFESAGIASGAGDFDFGMDDGVAGSDAPIIEGGEAKAGEKLEEFVIDAGEINDNQHVNIFKLISNRYLHSYSTLLDEAKPASK